MDSGLALAIVVSVIGHAALSGVGVWTALHTKRTQTPSVMNIRFAKLPAVVSVAPAPKPETITPATTATELAPPPKPKEKPVAASPFGKSAKKATAAPAVAPAPAPVAEEPVQSDVVLEGGDFPYTLYIDRMKTLLGSRWFRPQVGAGTTAIVYFVIDRDGTLRDAAIEKPSGNGAFDRGALRAVLESSPLPPLPFGYSGTYLGVHLTFR